VRVKPELDARREFHAGFRGNIRRVDIEDLLCDTALATHPLWVLRDSDVAAWRDAHPGALARWVAEHEFTAERHRALVLPSDQGGIGGVLWGVGKLVDWSGLNLWHTAGLVDRLPPGDYRLATDLPADAQRRAALGWLYGGLRADKPSNHTQRRARLRLPNGVDRESLIAEVRALQLARELINAPANDLGPAELGERVARLATDHGAQLACITGDALLAANYPLIHAVGKASPRAPRLLDLQWGDPNHPKVTLVGKGVCFDSGGLDIKSSAAMLLMKKDMAGAAVAIAVAQHLMQRRAPVRLRLLIPAVENAVGGAAYRPGDVLRSRRGLTVEVGNTDAEGRLVLADALTEADAGTPDLLLDFATLTGAARVALGPELPAMFGNDPALLAEAQAIGVALCDPVWPLPLWEGYDDDLSSRNADLANVAPNAFAGAIYGALFLRRFVTRAPHWLHFDIYGWNARERPGRPVGGEPQCVRLALELVRARFG
jgi:leucyl aminopeptidase